MNYKFDFAVSAVVSAKVVEEMVRKVVEEQTGKKVTKVSMKVSALSRGMGPNENTEHVFDGCTVYFENEPVTNNGSR
jgi:hypothetical protein